MPGMHRLEAQVFVITTAVIIMFCTHAVKSQNTSQPGGGPMPNLWGPEGQIRRQKVVITINDRDDLCSSPHIDILHSPTNSYKVHNLVSIQQNLDATQGVNGWGRWVGKRCYGNTDNKKPTTPPHTLTLPQPKAAVISEAPTSLWRVPTPAPITWPILEDDLD